MKAATPMKMRTRGTTTPAMMRAVFLLDAAFIGLGVEDGVGVELAASEDRVVRLVDSEVDVKVSLGELLAPTCEVAGLELGGGKVLVERSEPLVVSPGGFGPRPVGEGGMLSVNGGATPPCVLGVWLFTGIGGGRLGVVRTKSWSNLVLFKISSNKT
jgi:hypothetical protein